MGKTCEQLIDEVKKQIGSLPENMKDILREDKEHWLKIYGEELDKTGNHAEAEAMANQMLGIFGQIKIEDQAMNGDLVSEMDKKGW